jgi:pSer/pThr/pTyr-binding forkhead associated (FHA) protein
MAKLIIKFNNDVVDHIEIRQGDMKIGRKPGCDIVLDNLAVSGEHANVFTIGDDSFIQDLNSTNGTFINNKKITKHHLRQGDQVTIGKHTLVYMVTETVEEERPTEDFAKTVIINPVAREPAVARAPAPAPAAVPVPAPLPDAPPAAGAQAAVAHGALFILSGLNSGKRIELTKTVTNLGKTGRRAGTITRDSDGYLLASGTDEEPARLNGRPVPLEGARLKNGDIIEVAGTRLQFYLK